MLGRTSIHNTCRVIPMDIRDGSRFLSCRIIKIKLVHSHPLPFSDVLTHTKFVLGCVTSASFLTSLLSYMKVRTNVLVITVVQLSYFRFDHLSLHMYVV